MKMRMETDIKDLLSKMEATKMSLAMWSDQKNQKSSLHIIQTKGVESAIKLKELNHHCFNQEEID